MAGKKYRPLPEHPLRNAFDDLMEKVRIAGLQPGMGDVRAAFYSGAACILGWLSSAEILDDAETEREIRKFTDEILLFRRELMKLASRRPVDRN